MANEAGNPKIAEYGRLTRFGSSRNSPELARGLASPPWAISRAIRMLAAHEFDVSAGWPSRSQFRRVLNRRGSKLTGAQVAAVELWVAALDGNLRAMQRIVDILGP